MAPVRVTGVVSTGSVVMILLTVAGSPTIAVRLIAIGSTPVLVGRAVAPVPVTARRISGVLIRVALVRVAARPFIAPRVAVAVRLARVTRARLAVIGVARVGVPIVAVAGAGMARSAIIGILVALAAVPLARVAAGVATIAVISVAIAGVGIAGIGVAMLAARTAVRARPLVRI